MKVLWLSNVLFPEVCKVLGVKVPVVGGWMYSGAKALLKESSELQLGIISFYDGHDLKIIDKKPVTYYLVPKKNIASYVGGVEECFVEIKKEFKPNITHIHGSEYPHSRAYINSCGIENVVLSIQGLVSIYAKYYFGGIKFIAPTLRDLLRSDSIKQQQKNMEQRGKMEIELLQNVKYFIGRTSWDKNHIWNNNPAANYFFCNETLREVFYTKEWRFSKCQPHSVFLSQAHYPIKGLHQVIKALSIVLNHFPKTIVYVAGNNFVSVPKYKRNGFASYINNLMDEYNVRKQFIFLGVLNEEQMVEQYLRANVFVCPSVIENSPNSVGEAQLLGTPCVASYVGGTMDMIIHKQTGLLYRFEEFSMLAEHMCNLFSDRQLCEEISRNGQDIAKKRHDPKKNAQNLLKIYQTISNQ
nr:glycosyl transferase family GT4 [uncultured bacterium]